jgi:hypothetical protein
LPNLLKLTTEQGADLVIVMGRLMRRYIRRVMERERRELVQYIMDRERGAA